MELSDKWKWSKRKLQCRVRPETGNPSGDDLRERFAELAGADLNALLQDMKLQKKKREEKDKGVSVDYDAEKKFRDVLGRSHIIGASRFALEEMVKAEVQAATTVTQKNLKKVFARIPESPPKRVLLEIQRERSKPLRLPDQDEMAAASAKLEKKLEKEYRKRRAALEASEREEEAKRRGGGPEETAETSNIFSDALPPYHNPDLFSSNGPYLGSMLYLSRNAHAMVKSLRISGGSGGVEGDQNMGALQAALMAAQKKEEEEKKKKAEEERMLAIANDSSANDMGAKLYCAAALCNWSRNGSNASRLATEGGVRAIIQLSLESNPRIARFCAAACRFMSEHPVLSTTMIDEGAVLTISELVKSTDDEFISANLCIALVNLTMVHGRESSLVEGTVVPAFTHLVTVRSELAALCARGLYNLTCVDNSYPLIDRVIRYLVALSSNTASNVKHICASALCNLSDLKQMRGRLVEESVCSALSTLCRNTPTRTRRVCAVILQNLSASKSCRIEMVIRSSVHVAHSLSHDSDPIILRCVGLTLARLSMEAANCPRIIQEYGVTALSNIAQKFPTIPGITQPVATAFQMLASRPGIRVQAVQEGCVTAIAVLLRSSQDPFTLQNSIYALCLLLTEVENHLPIVQQGLLITLVSLSSQSNEQVKHLCALAFLNFSKSEDSHKHMVNAGSITAIILLSADKSVITRRRCAHALCNVSAYESGMHRMVSDGIISALVGLLNDDISTIHYVCAALCRLSSCIENATLIVDAGAVSNLVQFALKGENETKQFCGAVLSALSQYASCRVMLCEMGCISALKNQADLPDDVSQLRCLVAFANISCELAVQEQMVNEGVVEVIAKLIANSYHEKNYTCCAKALCNLACSPASRSAVATGGGVQALMLISMVHSVNKETKLLCVQALDNLLDDNTASFMLEEGLTTSLANLCKIGDYRVSLLCAKMFNQLSRFQEAMYKIVEKTPVTSAIYALAESQNAEMATIACRTTANLVLCGGPVRQKAIANGALRVLETGVTLNDEDTVLQCLVALFLSSQDAAFRVPMARSSMPATLINAAKSSSGEIYFNIAKILALLAFDPASRPFLQTKDIVSALIEVIRSNLPSHAAHWMAYALRYVSNGYLNLMELVSSKVMSALEALHALNGHDDIAICASETLRCISSHSEETAAELVSPSIIDILSRAVEVSEKSKDRNSTLMNCATTLACLAAAGTKARQVTGTEDAVPLLCALAKHSVCAEMTIAATFLYLNDPKTRYTFANESICLAIGSIFEFNKSNDCLYNCVSAVYALSRLPTCLEMLSRHGIALDAHLLRVSAMEDGRLQANCARALKNMTSDSTEAIEEGAVAALIAMSLEGKAKNSKVSDDLVMPGFYTYPKSTPPSCADEQIDSVKYLFVLPKSVVQGGESDTDLAHPDPPITEDVHEDALFPAEDLDGAETEGRAKMAFAKMQIPSDVKELFLLKDEDFVVKEDGEDEGEGEGTEIEGMVSNQYNAYDDNGEVVQMSMQGMAEEKTSSSMRGASPRGSKNTSPSGTPKMLSRKSFTIADGEEVKADPQSPKATLTRKSMKKSSDEKKDEGAAPSMPNKKGSRGEKDMKAQAAQLGLYK